MVALASGERVWVAETAPPADGASTEGANAGRADEDLVLCVHGMSGAAPNWTDLMAELAPDLDGAAFDVPGSGFAPPPETSAGYSVSALAGTVIRLIETLAAG